MNAYWIMTALTAAAGFALFALLLHRKGQGAGTAAAALLLCVPLGMACAKISYEILMRADFFLIWGEWSVFTDFRPGRMCFTGGAAGVVLGAVLASAALKKDRKTVLDCLAAPGALMIAGMRLAEQYLGSLGTGRWLEGEGLFSRPPFALRDAYGDSYAAIFFWEAAAALGLMILALVMRENRPGVRFEKTVFGLCLCQLLLENMRNHSMMWGFVHTEQLLCAVLLLLLTVRACRRRAETAGRYLPAVRAFLLMLLFAVLEFARQKSGVPLLTRGGYGFMSLILVLLAVNYSRTSQESSGSSSGQESSKGL